MKSLIEDKNDDIIKYVYNNYNIKEFLFTKKDKENNLDYYSLTILKNLTEKQIDILKQEMKIISNLNDNYFLKDIYFEKDENNDNYYIYNKLSNKKNI